MTEQSENKGFLGSKFENFEHKPKDALWERIHDEVNADKPSGALATVFQDYMHQPHKRVWRAIEAELFPQRKKNMLIWSWSAAASVVVLMSITILLQIFTKNEGQRYDQGISENIPALIKAEESTTQEHQKDLPEKQNKASLPVETIAKTEKPGDAGSKDKKNLIPADKTEKDYASIFDRLMPKKAKLEKYRYANIYMETLPILDFKKTADRPSNAIGVGSMLAANTPVMKSADMDESALTGNYNNVQTDIELSGGGLRESELYDNVEHDAPLSFGLQYTHYLTRKLNLAAGVSYTRLSSRGTINNNNWSSEKQSTKHYVGIPVNLNFEFVQRRKLALFTTAGLILEYGLHEKNRIIEYNKGKKMDEFFQNETIDKPQAGLLLGFGAQYHITKKFDFYLQTGASHYFYLSHYNLWSDQKVWPSVQLGFRVNL